MASPLRGRVIARVEGAVHLRDERAEVVEVSGDAEPGDLVEVVDGKLRVVRRYRGPDYPGPDTEVARLTPARMRGLRIRAQVLNEVRRFFAERDFLEIEPPLLVPSPGLEVHLQAVRAGDGYLITSPEYSMKRLLAAGLERIYALCRCFRGGESGDHHASEFTMLEWYRAYAGIREILHDTETLVEAVARCVSGAPTVLAAGRTVDVQTPWDRITVAEAFSRWVGVELVGDESADELRTRLAVAGVEVGAACEWDDLFHCAFLERVEPALAAHPRGLFLTNWPAPLAALARLSPDNPAVAERFEAYVGGVELANAFGELTDATAQRRRFQEELEARARRGLARYPVDERFLAALEEGIPPSGGIALGVDRLAMLAAGSSSVAEVSAFADGEL